MGSTTPHPTIWTSFGLTESEIASGAWGDFYEKFGITEGIYKNIDGQI